MFSTVGVDPAIEYLHLSPSLPSRDDPTIFDRYNAPAVDAGMVRHVLAGIPWSVPYAQLDRDTVLVAQLIDARVRQVANPPGPIQLDMLRSVFYRNKGAYLVGRVRAGAEGRSPGAAAAADACGVRGIVVDAVLMTSDEVSVVFGFSWTYFRVDAPKPRALVGFLGTIMPLKLAHELYTSIGYNKHGKTELYRSLMRQLEEPDAQFAFVEGEEGMVMAVFAPPLPQCGVQGHQGQLRCAQKHDQACRHGKIPVRVRAGPGGQAGGRPGIRAPGIPPPLPSG